MPVIFLSGLSCLQSEEFILCYIDGVARPLQYLKVCRLKPKLCFCFNMPRVCRQMLLECLGILTSEFTQGASVGTIFSGICSCMNWSTSRLFLSFLPHLEQAHFLSNCFGVHLQWHDIDYANCKIC